MENHSATTRAADHAWYRRACRSLSRSARRGSSCARLRLKVGVKTIPFSKKAGFDRSIRSKSNVEQTKEYKTHTTILVGARIESEGAISTVVGNMNMSCGHLQIYTRTSKKQRPSKVNQCPYACMFSHKLCVYIYIHKCMYTNTHAFCFGKCFLLYPSYHHPTHP